MAQKYDHKRRGGHLHEGPPKPRHIRPAKRTGVKRTQLQSGLLTRLPLEIRRQIYEYCITGFAISLSLDYKWIYDKTSFTTLLSHPRALLGWLTQRSPRKLYYRRLSPWSGAKVMLALPLTCKQVFEECFHSLYASNTFHLFHPSRSVEGVGWRTNESLGVLAILESLLAPRNLHALKTIELCISIMDTPIINGKPYCPDCSMYFQRLLDKVDNLQGLRNLCITFVSNSWGNEHLWNDQSSSWLIEFIEMLQSFKKLDVVVLRLASAVLEQLKSSRDITRYKRMRFEALACSSRVFTTPVPFNDDFTIARGE